MTGERILVVDDSKENREFVVNAVLRPSGFEPFQARDGLEGLELARRLTPDLILLDLQMPRMNGIQVLEALRRENLNVPVILMTFHGSEDIAVEVFRLGVRDYVKKPYTVDEMLAAIDASLTETRLRREKEALTNRLLTANRELHNRVRELNTLYSIGKSVTALISPPQLMARIVEAATLLTSAEQGSLWLMDEDQMTRRAVQRNGDPHAHPVMESSNDRLARHVIDNGTTVAPSSADLARLRERNPTTPVAVLIVPVRISDRVIGALGVERMAASAAAFAQHEAGLLSTLADYAAISLENAHNFAVLEATKDAENTRIRDAFARYLAPGVVDLVLRDPHEIQLGGYRRDISILFADLRGFTTFSEQTEPEYVVELLNEYLTAATDVILAREGTLDKFVGSAVMAFFNAPDEQADHPARAVDAALALQATINDLNARRNHEGLQFSIGVARGLALVGNIGAPLAMNYTAIGDIVNLAKRLQEHAQPGQILADESVIEPLGDDVATDWLGEVQVRGRRTPAAVYLVRGIKSGIVTPSAV
ncbi:MAG: response regulator [Aggregatilineales bacterium]